MKSVLISGPTNISVGKGTSVFSNPPLLISGPCVIESRDHAMKMAGTVSAIAQKTGLPHVYKSSYDKANRTSTSSFRGLGIEEGLRILEEVRREHGVSVLTDVHSEAEAAMAGEVVDIVQIPAFLCRQTSLLQAAGATGKTILIKKGQFLHPQDMRFAAEKVESAGNTKTGVLLCERGACFGYRELIVDYRGLGMMRELGYPVVFDATHSVQVMGGKNGSSGGAREWVRPLTRAAIAFGVDALFLETHQDPDNAPSDGPNMVPVSELEALLKEVKGVYEALAGQDRPMGF